jgi:hypothetical protein
MKCDAESSLTNSAKLDEDWAGSQLSRWKGEDII